MNKRIFLLSFFIFLLAFCIRVWNLNAAGQVWDEHALIYDYGYRHLTHAMNLDFGNEFWWKGEPDHPPLVRYLRALASLPDIASYDTNGWPIYHYDLTYNRLLSVILTSLGAVIVFLIGSRYLSLFTGLVAGMIFSLLPIPLGHSQIGMLEPLALFFFPLSMFTFFLFLEKQTIRRLLLAGVSLGLALLSRETHLMLLPMMIIIILIKHHFQHFKNLRVVFYKTFLIFLLAFFTFFCFWPMPFFHLDYMYDYFITLRLTVNTSIPEVFFGKLMLVPIPYYVVYFLITTPFLILLLFFSGVAFIYKSKSWVLFALVFWFLFPFLMSFYHTRQQGIRYIIQICIPLALLAAYGLEKFMQQFTNKNVIKIFVFIGLFLYQFIILWRITPYYLDYFNMLVGGAKGVYEKRLFHLAWWGEGIKEAFTYLEHNAPKDASIGIATSPSHILPPLPGRKISLYQDSKKYDYVVVNFYHVVRIGFDDSKIKKNYQLVYSVIADGAHLVEIYKKK